MRVELTDGTVAYYEGGKGEERNVRTVYASGMDGYMEGGENYKEQAAALPQATRRSVRRHQRCLGHVAASL